MHVFLQIVIYYWLLPQVFDVCAAYWYLISYLSVSAFSHDLNSDRTEYILIGDKSVALNSSVFDIRAAYWYSIYYSFVSSALVIYILMGDV